VRLKVKNNELLRRDGGLLVYNKPFVMLVDTSISGETSNTQFFIAASGSGHNYDVRTSEQELTNQTGPVILEWGSPGVYQVEISGVLPRFVYRTTADRFKILEIQQWGWLGSPGAPIGGSSFMGCSNLEVTATDLRSIVVADRAFRDCTSMVGNSSMGRWNIRGVQSISNLTEMFRGCTSFNQDLSGWCVEQIPLVPTRFATNTPAWTLPKPNWGQAC
jgi:hypothetical protein